MTPLDFVIVHDYPQKYKPLRRAETIEMAMEIAEIVTYQIHETGEDSLRTKGFHRKPFPKGAVLYVHGNISTGYENVGRVAALQQERPDLHFLLEVDEGAFKENFARQPDYELTKVLQEHALYQTRHASQPILYCDRLFFTFSDKNYWLGTYLQELKQIQGGI